MRMSSGGISRPRLVDIYEDPAHQSAAADTFADPRALYLGGSSDTSAAGPLYQLGGDVLPALVTRNGHGVRRFAPGSAQNTGAALRWIFPLGRPLNQIPSTLRKQLRMVWETIIERTTPLQANCTLSVGLRDDPFRDLDNALTGGSGGAAGDGGVILTSRTGLNAGRWTLAYRLTNGGATQATLDTGVAPGGLQHFKFEYFDRFPDPRLNIYLGGALVASLAGATLPAFDGQEGHWPTVQAGAPLIGQQDHQYLTRFYIEEI